jgi:transcriptional regulator with XRE-family HTH domain
MPSDDIGERIGQRIRILRKAAGLTQAQLAERVQPAMEPETIGRFERGERVPPLDRIEVIAVALVTDLDGFLAGMLTPSAVVPGQAELQEVVAMLAGRPAPVVAGAARVLRAHLAVLDGE